MKLPLDPTLRFLLAESIKPYSLEDLELPQDSERGRKARELACKVIADAFNDENWAKWRGPIKR